MCTARGVFPVVIAFLLAVPAALLAQTSTTATVVGTVSDPTGALVSGATVELRDIATNQTRSTTTNDVGQYILTSVLPGTYRMTVSMAGFRQSVFSDLSFDVTKSYNIPVKLEVGGVTETVSVTAAGATQLQTLDATVGSIIDGEALLRLPAINRSATALLTIQPMVAPARGVGVTAGGQVAGARSDQSTFNLDGTDATDLTSGTSGYFSGAIDASGGAPSPFVPVPLDSLDEFRVSTTNPNATFGRSAGGQVSLVTRRGSNTLHGTAYLYHQNDNLNANTWTFNRLGIRKPELKDNRFGVSLGGPIIKDRTFLFGHYEGRRFPRSVNVTRVVPTPTLKQGVLRFRDTAGNVTTYNTRDFDPRGRGLSPVVSRLWNGLPDGNDASVGDGLNTIGFTAPSLAPLRMDFGVARFDHQFSSNWRFYSTYRYAKQFVFDTTQVDIAGFSPGAQRGIPKATGLTPVEPRFFSAQLLGTITPNVINELNVGYTRNFWAYKRVNPFPQVEGTAAGLMVGRTGATQNLNAGVDFDTQNGRSRIWRDQTYYLSDNLTWIKGKHSLQFGGALRFMPFFHERDDKVIGSLTYLVYELNAANYVSIPASSRPPTCAAGATGACLGAAADVTRWNDLFAASLGIVNKAGVVVTRDTNLNDLPLGTPMRIYGKFNNYEFYGQDIWRVSPAVTITAGITYSISTPPVDNNGLQTILIDTANGEALTSENVLGRRRQAALEGRTYNPQIGYLPLRNSTHKYIYDIDWNNLGPRVSVAWNPNKTDGVLGKLFGPGKTVIRGGYGVTFDRVNGVGVVMLPILGVGFSQTRSCFGPRIDGSCSEASDVNNAWRLGVEGSTSPLPVLPKATSPVVPGIAGETLSFSIDPDYKVGRSQSVNLTVQRELPKRFILELGYAGRYANNLPVNKQLNSVPYMFKDSGSSQTFAQAFDAVAAQLRAGVPGAGVTAQPWFENQFRGVAACGASCTQWLAGRNTADFVQGRVNTLVRFLNTVRPGGSLTNRQVDDLFVRDGDALSNYNAGFLTLTRRFGQGLSFTANYTFSRSLDQYGLNQENIGVASTSYDLNVDYGPALWDRTHVFNLGGFYELPIGPGRRFAVSGPVNKIVGGWYFSGVYTANSGLPLVASQHGEAFGGAQQFAGIEPGVVARDPGTKYSNSVANNVRGSGGVGTSSDPARRGSGLNLFSDPEAVYKSLRPLLLSQDGRYGRGVLRGLPRWNIDFSVGKKTAITERVRTVFTFDMINAINRVEFADPSVSYQTPASFGVITGQFANGSRQIQMGLRFEF